ncbi:NUDIX domain-containing protein [Bacteroidales bacterium]|nr:NUDIX domain-containing protein [Bacteroidales bacterium]
MDQNNIIQNLSIDCVIYSFHEEKLKVLCVKHAEGMSTGEWGLPGGYVNGDEDIDAAAARILGRHTSLDNVFLEQLRAFGEVNRHPQKRVITISYFALVKYSDANIKAGPSVYQATWYPVDDYPELIFDHQKILDFGNQWLQHLVRHEPIGFNLLPTEFTLLQLQSLYEAILNTSFDKPNFRRKLLKMKLLIDTNKKQQNVSHRAANLYRFNEEIYNRLKEKGFSFDL